MKFFSVVAFSALVALVPAQDASSILNKLPDCAKTCVQNGLPKNCGSDTSCICKSDSFVKGTTCCVKQACNAKDASSVVSLAKMICTDLPTSADCAATASATSGATETGSSAADNTGAAESSGATPASLNGAFITAAPRAEALALMGAAMYFF
ncbi:Extracellular membrane protein, CFEM domain protein [Ascosphaera apis ARSEF 7405]|uniref:Extracellular membrane protein, CFEM domain protein n=1 Tax=Ascosphaera apis ARSEF 7405 TaxID=392613 RepID=A0A166NXG3_9EURO|nr:Extracellular membrane protein, CFEM domain protein [Ascosphaera apis ARSEF 7405]